MHKSENKLSTLTTKFTSLYSQVKGSIVLEAAIIMPFFLAFILIMIGFLHVCAVELALQDSVSEAVQQVSAHAYPVQLLYEKVSNLTEGTNLQAMLQDALAAREGLIKAEHFVNEYAALVPDFIYRLMRWEQTHREQLETGGFELYQRTLNETFQPFVAYYADNSFIRRDRITVTKVHIPNLAHRNPAYFGLEVQYELTMPIPFFHRTLRIHKKAKERVWIGAAEGDENL